MGTCNAANHYSQCCHHGWERGPRCASGRCSAGGWTYCRSRRASKRAARRPRPRRSRTLRHAMPDRLLRACRGRDRVGNFRRRHDGVLQKLQDQTVMKQASALNCITSLEGALSHDRPTSLTRTFSPAPELVTRGDTSISLLKVRQYAQKQPEWALRRFLQLRPDLRHSECAAGEGDCKASTARYDGRSAFQLSCPTLGRSELDRRLNGCWSSEEPVLHGSGALMVSRRQIRPPSSTAASVLPRCPYEIRRDPRRSQNPLCRSK